MVAQPKFEIVRDRSNYFVTRDDGTTAYGPTSCIDRAHEALMRLKHQKQRKTRKCMTCAAEFTSEGAHNRLCNSCRSQSVYDGSA